MKTYKDCKCGGPRNEKACSKDSSTSDGLSSRCKKCRSEWKKLKTSQDKKFRDKLRCDQYKRYYGITLDEYNKMLLTQNSQCLICKKPPSENRKLAVDHCHETGKIRGLLCIKCNAGISHFNDDINVLMSAIAYLKNNN